jgi:hypothetical protein
MVAMAAPAPLLLLFLLLLYPPTRGRNQGGIQLKKKTAKKIRECKGGKVFRRWGRSNLAQTSSTKLIKLQATI